MKNLKNEIQFNVGNIDRKTLMEDFSPMGMGQMGMMTLASLEAESNILQSIAELGRNIKNLEFRIKDLDSEKKEKLFKSIREKLEVLEEILKEVNSNKDKDKDDEGEGNEDDD